MTAEQWADADVEETARTWFEADRVHLYGNVGHWESDDEADAYRSAVRRLLASGVVVPARVVEEAERDRDRAVAKAEDYEGKYETSHASRMHAEDCYRRAEAETARLRAAIETLCANPDDCVEREHENGHGGTFLELIPYVTAHRLRAVLAAQPKAGE